MNRPRLTGLVLTHGERSIAPTVESIQDICDQIVIVNDLNTNPEFSQLQLDLFDGNVAVVDRVFDTFPRQRNAGLEKAIGAWVLVIDSDETASQSLQLELEGFQPDNNIEVFTLPRREIFRGRELERVKIGGPHPRLFRSHLRYAQVPKVHERLEGWKHDHIGALEGHLLHHRTGSVLELLRKEYLYGKSFGQFSNSETQHFSWYRLLRQSIGDFAVRDGLHEGIEGAIVTIANIAAKVGEKHSRTTE